MTEITYQNIDEIIERFSIKEHGRLRSLLDDVYSTNKLKCVPIAIAIGIVDCHTDSDECPDMYGFYKIYAKTVSSSAGEKVTYDYEPLSLECDIDELDTALCTITSYFDFLNENGNFG